MRFRLPGEWDIPLASTAAWVVTGTVARTLRITTVNAAETNHRLAHGQGQLIVTWHGRTLLPLIYFRGKKIVSMVSPSRDGEIQYRVHRRFGWDAVRGSSGRDATRAVIGAVKRLRTGTTIAVAPDGPKGPIGSVQAGTLYLAWKSGCPVVPIGASATRGWEMKSWDRFLLPKPFARLALVFGEPIVRPEGAKDEWVHDTGPALADAINEAQRRADEITGYRSPAVDAA
jgi:lysophospholipid acyltransferase (LPLAT)-like uncharacterized protein